MRHLAPVFPYSRQEGESSSVDWYNYRLFSISGKSVLQSCKSLFSWQRIGRERTQRGVAATPVAQTSKSAVSRVSKPADGTTADALPTWKSPIQQVWKPALQRPAVIALKNPREDE
jgi:hypothetical protein